MGGWGGGIGYVVRMVCRGCCLVWIGTRLGWFGLDWSWYIIVGEICEYFHTEGMRIFVDGVVDGGVDGFRYVGP